MSLLIKALKKAEQSKDAKTEANSGSGGLTLELTPLEEKPQETSPALAEEVGLSASTDKNASAETAVMSSSDAPKPEQPVAVQPAAPNTMAEDDIAAALMEESGFSLTEEAGFSEPAPAKTAKAIPSAKAEKTPKPVKTFARESAPEQPAITTTTAAPASSSEQRSAATNLLNTRQGQKRSPGSRRSLFLGLIGLVLLLVLGGGFYYYLQTLDQPKLMAMQQMPRSPAPPATPIVPAATPQTPSPPAVAEIKASPALPATPVAPSVEPSKASDKMVQQSASSEEPMEQTIVAKPRPITKSGPSKKAMAMRHPAMGDEDSTMKVSRLNKGGLVTDATQVAAYQAYEAGDDATASQLYRQVLQNDPRNVDALLSLAAVAARQGHTDEAVSAYQRALELDPNNNVAQEGLIVLLGQANPTESVSRLKTLIAQQPDAAHLHAALGGVYADQNQWPDAQQAYFKAFSLDPNNAEYAFNLAVSLDQLKKPDLALNYYQQALALLTKQGGAVDKATLENRINQLRSASGK